MNMLRIIACALLLAGCAPKQQAPAPAAPASPLKPIAGIQDVMAGMIDPAADFLWESVSTTVTGKETVEKQPRTDAEWAEVRRQAPKPQQITMNQPRAASPLAGLAEARAAGEGGPMPKGTAMSVTFASPRVPVPWATVHSWVGSEGWVRTFTS